MNSGFIARLFRPDGRSDDRRWRCAVSVDEIDQPGPFREIHAGRLRCRAPLAGRCCLRQFRRRRAEARPTSAPLRKNWSNAQFSQAQESDADDDYSIRSADHRQAQARRPDHRLRKALAKLGDSNSMLSSHPSSSGRAQHASETASLRKSRHQKSLAT